jgi:hypothetical protein
MDTNRVIKQLVSSLDNLEVTIMEWWTGMGSREEKRIERVYHNNIEIISKELGKPYYQGEGERYGAATDYHSAYFMDADQALQITLWDRETSVALIMLTGHDADTLKTIQICQSCKKMPENSLRV